MDGKMPRNDITQTLNGHSDRNGSKTKNGLSGLQNNHCHYPHRKVFDNDDEIVAELDIDEVDCNNVRLLFNFTTVKL